MADVFVSYSRTDIAFARILHQALKDNGFETWIDWQDIPPSAEWLAEVYEAIEKADTFVFLISQASVDSEICGLEIAHAAKNNKRLIPVVIGEVEPEQVAPELAALNWLFFRTEDDFSQVLEDLIDAIETDHAWVKEHTRLQVRALEWERNDQEGGYLLRGADLSRAEQWLARSPDKEPEPTGLQTQYLLASRRAAIRRHRLTLGVVLTGLLLAIALGALAWMQRNEAITQGNMRATAQSDAEAASIRAVAESWERATAQAVAVDESHMRATSEAEAETRASVARSRQLAIASTSQLDVDQELALLLAVEAAREADTDEAADALRRALVHRGRTLRLLLGHGAEVYCAEWDPEGGRVLSAGADGTARVWDAVTGEEQLVLAGHTGAVVEAVWDDSGRRIATAGADGMVRMWNARTGREQLALEAHAEGVNALMWSPDGRNLVTAGEDGHARVWDAVSGEQLVVFSAHEEPIRHAAWNGEGSYVLTSSPGGAWVWDGTTGRELARLSPTPNVDFSIKSAAWGADGTQIATGWLGRVSVWDLSAIDSAGGEVIEPQRVANHSHRVPGMEIGAIAHVAWASNDARLLSLSTDSTAEIWDAETGEGLAFLVGHTGGVSHGAWGPGNSLVATASDDGTACVWEAESGREAGRLTGHTQAVNSVAWDPEGERLVTASADGTVRIWAVEAVDEVAALNAGVQDFSEWSWDGSLLVTGGYGSRVWDPDTGVELAVLDGSAAWNPAGPGIMTVGEEGPVRLWDTAEALKTGEEDAARVTLPGTSAVWSPDGTRVVSWGEDVPVVVWDAASGEELVVLSIEGGAPRHLAWSPDGTRIGTVDREQRVEVWDAGTGARLQELPQVAETVDMVSWDPASERLLTAGDADTVRVWDARSAVQLAQLSGHGDWAFWAAWSPDGSRIVTTARDGTARVWEAASGRELCVFSGHDGGVSYAAWNPDGTVIATASYGRKPRIWDAANGKELVAIGGYFDAVRHTAWSADGRRLAVTSWGGPARVFDVPLTRMEEAACDRAVRNMSGREWATHMGTAPYRETCPGKPTLEQ